MSNIKNNDSLFQLREVASIDQKTKCSTVKNWKINTCMNSTKSNCNIDIIHKKSFIRFQVWRIFPHWSSRSAYHFGLSYQQHQQWEKSKNLTSPDPVTAYPLGTVKHEDGDW